MHADTELPQHERVQVGPHLCEQPLASKLLVLPFDKAESGSRLDQLYTSARLSAAAKTDPETAA